MPAKIGLLVAVCVMLAPTLAVAEGDPEAGRDRFETCRGCHGIKGYQNVYPTYHVPLLLGQHPEYIVASLKAYRSGERDHATMHAQASSRTDQEVEDIAAYLASLSEKEGSA